MGIEPTCSARKADVLPLNYIRISARAAGLEPTPLAASASVAGLRFHGQRIANVTQTHRLPLYLLSYARMCPPKGLCERDICRRSIPGCQVTKYSINGTLRSHWILPFPVHARFGAYRAAERPIDIRRRHEKREPSAPPTQARAPLRAIYPRPTSAGRVIGGSRRAGMAESEVLVVVSLLSRYSVANLSG